MKTWTKRYAISFLLAVFVLSASDAYRHPTDGPRTGAVIVVAAIWPVALAIVVGWTVGEAVREHV
jgi:hypothetical protein